MATWEKEIRAAVHENNINSVKAILARDEVKREGDLGRKEWQQGEAPLHLAASYGKDEVIQLMKEAGLNVNSFCNDSIYKCTSLHFAVLNNKESTVKVLLQLGADCRLEGTMRHVSWQGTPLDWAKQMDHNDLAHILEKHEESFFATLEASEKVMLKQKKDQELREAMKLQGEIEAKNERIKSIDDSMQKLAKEKRQLAKEVNKLEERDLKRTVNLLTKQLKEINALAGTLEVEPLPSLNECPSCRKRPQQVFSCSNEECENWICQACKAKLQACPKCKEDFNVHKPQRSKQLERIMSIG